MEINEHEDNDEIYHQENFETKAEDEIKLHFRSQKTRPASPDRN